MRRLKVKELVAEAHASVPELPAKHGRLMKEVVTRLAAILNAAKRAHEESAAAAGIGKGEA